MIAYLKQIYTGHSIEPIMRYITFKLKCAREQEEVKWKVNIQKVNEGLEVLYKERETKLAALQAVIPPRTLYKKVSMPKALTTKDGNLSAVGKRWYHNLGQAGLPLDHVEDFKLPSGTEPGNPGSVPQIKAWLYTLGWVPQTFMYDRNKETGAVRKIEQLSLVDGSDICPSIKLLYEKEPALKHLEGLFIVRHRIGILEGFLRDADSNDYLMARVIGFTNTMRFQHTELVNLPTVNKPYGELIRGCLTVPDDSYLLCGSDMSSLEDSTKQHYMHYFDPEYVKEMRDPTFDPHIDIGVQGGTISQEEADFYRWMDGKPIPEERIAEKYLKMNEDERKAEVKRLSKERKDSKQVNFSAVYGVGAPKMSLTTGWPQSKSKALLEVYWKRNWAVKTIAKKCTVKTVGTQMWLYNAVSGFWYSLRYDKDRFSTLNQGTGVYCFDTYVKFVRRKGIRICGQFHDEIAFPLKVENKEKVEESLRTSIKEVNNELKLNVELGISIAFGHNYAETH